MIHTLEWLRKEAQGIQAAWNGESETFYYEDTKYDEGAVQAAKELEEYIKKIDELTEELSL